MLAPPGCLSMSISWACLLSARMPRAFGLDLLTLRADSGLRSVEEKASAPAADSSIPSALKASGVARSVRRPRFLSSRQMVSTRLAAENLGGCAAGKFGGERVDRSVRSLAGGRENDELGAGKRHGGAPCVSRAATIAALLLPGAPAAQGDAGRSGTLWFK